MIKLYHFELRWHLTLTSLTNKDESTKLKIDQTLEMKILNSKHKRVKPKDPKLK